VKTDANSGGLTDGVTYRGICMTNIKHVLIFNPFYSAGGTSVIVPTGPESDARDDVTDTPFTGTGSVPTCDIPAFGPPPAA
jgi:hypothetical protein